MISRTEIPTSSVPGPLVPATWSSPLHNHGDENEDVDSKARAASHPQRQPTLPPTHEAPPPIETDRPETSDDEFFDSDPDWASELTIEDISTHFTEENGRRYPRGSYPLPNDQTGIEYMAAVSLLFRTAQGGAWPPYPPGRYLNVLHVSAGAGEWAMDYADEHPGAIVTGIDAAPFMPEWTPPNCFFLTFPYEGPWNWRRQFDLIRLGNGCFADHDIITQAFRYLSPGGRIEIERIQLTPRCDDDADGASPFYTRSHLWEWSRQLNAGLTAINYPMHSAAQHEAMLRAAGFVNIRISQYRLPTNRWPAADQTEKAMGEFNVREGIGCHLEGISLAPLTRGLAWAREEVLVFCAAVRSDIRNVNMRAYFPMFICTADKPGA